jgi:hypothetical protein
MNATTECQFQTHFAAAHASIISIVPVGSIAGWKKMAGPNLPHMLRQIHQSGPLV